MHLRAPSGPAHVCDFGTDTRCKSLRLIRGKGVSMGDKKKVLDKKMAELARLTNRTFAIWREIREMLELAEDARKLRLVQVSQDEDDFSED